MQFCGVGGEQFCEVGLGVILLQEMDALIRELCNCK